MFDAFDAGSDDAFRARIGRRPRRDPETLAYGAFGGGALGLGVAVAGPGDRALEVVDDDPADSPAETIEGVTMAGELGLDRLVTDEFGISIALADSGL